MRSARHDVTGTHESFSVTTNRWLVEPELRVGHGGGVRLSLPYLASQARGTVVESANRRGIRAQRAPLSADPRPLNRLWLKLGFAMHAVVSPVVMGLLFYGTVTPIGVLFQ